MDPSGDYRPGAFWCWLNGNMSKEAITRDLQEMKAKGMGRAEIWDVAAINNKDNYIPAGPAFMSDSSVALIRHALKEGERLGMKIGMVGSSGWNAGGTWVEPDWASKQLYFSEADITGPFKGTLNIPFPEVPKRCPKDETGMPLFWKEVAVVAVPFRTPGIINSVDDILILDAKISDDKINLQLPAGKWKVLRFICSNNGQRLIVPSPKSGGLFIDFLDPESTKKHLGHFMNRLGFEANSNTKEKLAYIEFDSMELDEGIAWTDAMPEVFRQMRGYDITRYLPVLAGWDIKGATDRFMYDWKLTISDQLIYSHYTTGREFLEEYGIDLVAEAGGPGPPTWSTCPVDALKALGNVSIPRGEFWVQHRHIFLVKEVASAAHIYGRKVVDAESFTTWRRWKDSPFDLKKLVDRAFGEGLNFVTFHTFASTNPEDGLPGRTYHAGSDVNTTNTWWNKSGPFMDYLSRCSYMLQQGTFVADVCYYYGDQAPNFFPAWHVVPEKIIPEDLGRGYDFDVVNSDVILNRMTVRDGKITLPDGLSYAALVLPDQDHIPLHILQRLESMVKEGATIIGRKPAEIPYLNNHATDKIQLNELASRMWEGIDGKHKTIHQYGKGRVVYGLTARELLMQDGQIQDFSYNEPGQLDYIHRNAGTTDIYFIYNETDQPFTGYGSFRISGRHPEFWDPATGNQLRCADFEDDGIATRIELNLDARESLFVVFTGEERTNIEKAKTGEPATTIITLNGDWHIAFPDGWGAPKKALFDRLHSWTDSDIEGIRYFSGTATYDKTFTLGKDDISGSRIELDLGEVFDVAEVFVNGRSAGILWKPPYVADISKLVRKGKNRLKIEVVNQWVNRLTGDMLAPPENRYCRTNHPYITSDDFGVDNWAEGGDETYRVQKSGLLGPVSIIKY